MAYRTTVHGDRVTINNFRDDIQAAGRAVREAEKPAADFPRPVGVHEATLKRNALLKQLERDEMAADLVDQQEAASR